MSIQKVNNSNPYKHNGGTIVKAGNADTTDGPITSSVSEATLAFNSGYGSKAVQAVSPTESGVLGTYKPISAASFGRKPVAGEYTVRILGTKVAGITNNILRSGASDVGLRRPIAVFQGYNQNDITSWDYVTGAATKGGNAGARVLPSGVDGNVGPTVDHAANPTDAIPGELVYMTTGYLPTQDNYKPRTS